SGALWLVRDTVVVMAERWSLMSQLLAQIDMCTWSIFDRNARLALFGPALPVAAYCGARHPRRICATSCARVVVPVLAMM
ncbi:MAG TPA: hypothetical protein VHZ98_01485, partial [Galbitalea sp.]|nr:hypothetical protein [Galbitalea sp.]